MNNNNEKPLPLRLHPTQVALSHMEKVKVENGGYLAVAVMADFGEVQEDLTKNVIFDKDLEKMRE